MTSLELPALTGANPLSFLAALGVLDVLERRAEKQLSTLRWTDGLQPHAVVTGAESLDALVDLIDEDRRGWRRSPLLTWRMPEGMLPDDVKASETELHRWAEHLYEHVSETDRGAANLWCALLAEGALAKDGKSAKPTHLHFTAGQQQFLRMVRELAGALDRERVLEGLIGPWRYDSELPSLRWDVRGERLYAISARNPSSDPPRSVPAANWLGFLGLRFLPVAAANKALLTTACAPEWKSGGSMTWPLWEFPLRASSVFSMLTSLRLEKITVPEQRALGISSVLQSPIRRSEQGGYGSFGAPTRSFGQH